MSTKNEKLVDIDVEDDENQENEMNNALDNESVEEQSQDGDEDDNGLSDADATDDEDDDGVEIDDEVDDLDIDIDGEMNEDEAIEEEVSKTGRPAKTTTTTNTAGFGTIAIDEPELEDSESESDDELEEKLKVFDKKLREDYITKYHHELKQLSNEEVQALTAIIRDENGNVIDDLHQTPPIVTRFERARIIGMRATQLDHGAEPMIEIDEDIIDSVIIAEKEFEAKVLPFIIMRPIPGGRKEYWKLRDLEIVDT